MDESYVTTPPGEGKEVTGPESRDFVAEALETFREDEASDFDNRAECLIDLQFQALRQWDQNEKMIRTLAGRPSFVCDMLSPFIRQVDGELRLNPPSAKVFPGENGDTDIAEVMAGLLRSMHHLSFGDQVFSKAGGQAAACGMGHFRLSHEFKNPSSFLTVLRWRPIPNPLAVIRDPDCVLPDHSDAKRCFVFDDISRRAFAKRYPNAAMTPFDHSQAINRAAVRGGWFTRDTIRVAEYWLLDQEPGTLTLFDDGSEWMDIDPGQRFMLLAQGRQILAEREVKRPKVCMYLMTGAEVLGKYEWKGSRIPIDTVEGETINVDGETVRRGIIRTARDPQIVRNWAMSAEVETVALAPLQKWLATAPQIKGYEHMWRNANSALTATLLYNKTDADGNDLGKPDRMEPPEYNQAAAKLADRSVEYARQATGMFAANLGEKDGGVTAGVAIDSLREQGEAGSFLYIDNLLVQIQSSSQSAIELMPKVYDTPRQERILGEDMRPKIVKVNSGGLDLNVGEYDCIVGTGPSFKTARQETAKGMREALKYLPGELAVPVVIRLAEHEEWPRAAELADEIKQIAMAKGLLPGAQAPAPTGAPGMPAQNAPGAPAVALPMPGAMTTPGNTETPPAALADDFAMNGGAGPQTAAATYGAPGAAQGAGPRPRPRLVSIN